MLKFYPREEVVNCLTKKVYYYIRQSETVSFKFSILLLSISNNMQPMSNAIFQDKRTNSQQYFTVTDTIEIV